ncbi:MAG TPA: SpoIVB peptidase S55 domain-containing protein, partial [Thermoanaerobaculia bacterium]|nr:SpoIVB peptidase S55 domain-containing protein [Thermoanaerobaculia bacterium]
MKYRSIPLTALGLLAALPFLAAANDQPPKAPSKVEPPASQVVMPTSMPTLSVDQVKRGQRGYGLSVFAGTEPERFEVEVIWVMRNVSPNVSYILARLEGKGLDKIGVAAGMSGSPVFIDGKLVGAVSFSWPFSQETIGGITPIEDMRRLSGLGPLPATPLPPVPLADIMARKIPADLLERELARLQPRLAGGGLPGIVWATQGFGDQSLAMMRRALQTVSAAGEARPEDVPRDLEMGGAVAAVLVDGDFGLAGFGTVTDRYEDQVLAFGHPFMGLGPVQVPMATAEVVTIFSSQLASFKISNIGHTIGAFEQDRQAGIQGRIGATAPMTPMVLRVAGGLGEKPREYKVRVAEIPLLTPSLIGSTVVAGLESASYTAGSQSLDMTARFKLARYGDLLVRQSFDGASAGSEAAAYVLAVAGFLTQNDFEKVDLEAVEVDIQQSPEPRAATLVGAHAERTVVRPGERIGLNLDLMAYRGERFRRSLNIDLPQDLPAGRYTLLVGDGSSADAARMTL